MKKLITLLTALMFSVILFSQNIENKLGAGGDFIIQEANGTEVFKFTHDLFNDPELTIGKNTINVGNNDVWMLNMQSKVIGPFVSLAGLENAIGGSQLWFQKARFVDASLLPPLAGDDVGKIIFSGYQGSSFHSVAAITSNIIAPGSTQPSADLKFWTSTIDAGTAVRMTVKDDGKVGVGTTTPTSTLDINGSVSKSVLVTSGTITASSSDHTIFATAATTITLPTPSADVKGRVYVIKKGVGVFNVVISSDGSGLIDGLNSRTLDTDYEYIRVQCSGAVWMIIGGNYTL